MEFKSLHIKNYKNIEDLDLYFDEKKIQLILLEQVGKANLLSAIQYCLFDQDYLPIESLKELINRDYLHECIEAGAQHCIVSVRLIGEHQRKLYTFQRLLQYSLQEELIGYNDFSIEIKDKYGMVASITSPIESEKIVNDLFPNADIIYGHGLLEGPIGSKGRFVTREARQKLLDIAINKTERVEFYMDTLFHKLMDWKTNKNIAGKSLKINNQCDLMLVDQEGTDWLPQEAEEEKFVAELCFFIATMSIGKFDYPILIRMAENEITSKVSELLYHELANQRSSHQIIIVQNPHFLIRKEVESGLQKKLNLYNHIRIVWLGNFKSNIFSRLIMDAYMNNWCTKIYCTTCGCHEFRGEIKKLDFEKLIISIFDLHENEFRKLPGWFDCIEVAWGDLRYQSPVARLYKKYGSEPEIVEEVKEFYRRRREAKELKFVEIESKVQEKRNEKAEHHLAYLNRQQGNRKNWYSKMDVFKNLSLESRLNIVASDYAHSPNYYPIDLEKITEEDLKDIKKETILALINRFLILNKKEWKEFYNKLLDQ